jgi:hypothetical protein
MVNKYSLDEKLKDRENAVILNEIEDARRFVRYFVNLMEGILNYEYDELKSYFEEDKTEAEIRIIEKRYNILSGIKNCYISTCVKLCREDFSYPKLKVVGIKVAGKFFCYTMDVDYFIYGSVDDEKFITNYLQAIKSDIFKDFKYDWSYNKDKIFKRYIKNKNITPSQYIIECINNYVYNDIIKPKSKTMTREEFLNSEFKFEVDEKTQRIYNKYFFENI